MLGRLHRVVGLPLVAERLAADGLVAFLAVAAPAAATPRLAAGRLGHPAGKSLTGLQAPEVAPQEDEDVLDQVLGRRVVQPRAPADPVDQVRVAVDQGLPGLLPPLEAERDQIGVGEGRHGLRRG